MDRFQGTQQNRTLNHPKLPQPSIDDDSLTNDIMQDAEFQFVVAADTQFGMLQENANWDNEVEYSRKAVRYINSMSPRPLFCCICGDLVDMTASINAGTRTEWTEEACNRIQDEQYADFKKVWAELHADIALVCICGNHDVGNRPNKISIERFTNQFGNDYVAFWAPGRTYNIVVNTNLFSDPSEATDQYKDQLQWLEQRLAYAASKEARLIFVFGHHPWFLYNEDEESDDLKGSSPYPDEWNRPGATISDGYFHIPKERRIKALNLFHKFGVNAAFSGHFHQNLIARTDAGMEMIVTGSLSIVLKSNGIPKDFNEPQTTGVRVVSVSSTSQPSYSHKFESIL